MNLRTLPPSQLTKDEIAVISGMTLQEKDSDLNRTLRDLAKGLDLDSSLVIVLAEEQGIICGWATAELWTSPFGRQHPLDNVFVRPSLRGLGIGWELKRKADGLLNRLIAERRKSA